MPTSQFFGLHLLLLLPLSAAVISLIPVAPGWVVSNTDVGLLAAFAILGFFPLIALLFSWASNSNPFIGGLRALHQMIAFEIPFILSALSVVILSGSLNLTHIAACSDTILVYLLFANKRLCILHLFSCGVGKNSFRPA